MKSDELLYEIIISCGLAICVIVVSLATSEILRLSPILSMLLLGVKNKKYNH